MITPVVRECHLKRQPGLLWCHSGHQTSPNLKPPCAGDGSGRQLRKPYIRSIAPRQSIEAFRCDADNLKRLGPVHPTAKNIWIRAETPGPELVVQDRDVVAIVGLRQHSAKGRINAENSKSIAGDLLYPERAQFVRRTDHRAGTTGAKKFQLAGRSCEEAVV